MLLSTPEAGSGVSACREHQGHAEQPGKYFLFAAQGIFSNFSSMYRVGRCTAGAAGGDVDRAQGNSCEWNTVCEVSLECGNTEGSRDGLGEVSMALWRQCPKPGMGNIPMSGDVLFVER